MNEPINLPCWNCEETIEGPAVTSPHVPDARFCSQACRHEFENEFIKLPDLTPAAVE